MSNLRLDLGLIAVEAAPATAFAGHAGRVFATEREALIDMATSKLAKIWLNKCEVGMPSFAKLMEYVETDPALFESAAKLARFKSAR